MNTELPIGAIVMLDGRRMRHMGGGKLEPAPEELLAKRFDTMECEPLHKVPACI